MTNKCVKFGQGQDLLGKQVQLNYKGGAKYGTSLGGYCSLLARLLIWMLAAVEIWSCLTEPINIEA